MRVRRGGGGNDVNEGKEEWERGVREETNNLRLWYRVRERGTGGECGQVSEREDVENVNLFL